MTVGNMNSAELRCRAEERLAQQTHALPDCEPDARRLMNELMVNQIELEMQRDHILATQAELQKSVEELRIAAITFESQQGVIITDAKGVIVRVNRAFTALTGFSAEEAVGQTPAILRSGRQLPEFYQRLWHALEGAGYWQGEIWNRRKSGKIYAEWLTISAVVNPAREKTHYVAAFSDITENKEAAAQIHRLAYYDPLTTLPNRALFHDRMRQTITSSSRSGHYGALLFIDLDNFKNINDTRGHEFGDRVLVEAAKRILANVRAGDTVGRLGGDEFVVMLEDLSEESTSAATQTSLVGEKIRECLAQPFELDGAVAHSSASLGACLFHGHDVTEDALFRQADLAMYKAKSGGRNLLRFFDPLMQTALDERSAIEDDLRLALARGELQLYYQPQADHARRVLGAECLLRWLHPVRGQIPPIDFVPLAEDTGLIIAIGTWVLRIACAQLKAWAAAPETRQLQLAVNVSARQFQQPNFVDVVLQVLHETGADASRLKLELTESMLLGDVEVTINKMQSLQSHGITFSLDDFGTGFSSLSYLTRLPLCQLKIDRSFVLNLPENQNDSVVAQTIISMAQSLGMDVIAEGVETEAQRDFLERNHCKAYQGFLFSRPLSLEDFEALLKRNS